MREISIMISVFDAAPLRARAACESRCHDDPLQPARPQRYPRRSPATSLAAGRSCLQRPYHHANDNGLLFGQPARGCAGPHAGCAAGPVWVCRPGQAANPCAANLAATTVTAGGTLQPASWPRSATASKFACFYVHGSDGPTGIGNTSLAVTTVDISVAEEQGAPFSQVCQVWAPSYRSATLPTVAKGIAGNQALLRSTSAVAYDSVLPAWEWFLAHTGSEPIILIGDSQGSAVLIDLISAQLDHEPSVLRRLLVAILVGGNLQVPAGKTAGATFTKVPLCTADTETGCAIAFSSYPFAATPGFAVRQAGPGREPPVRPDRQGRPAGRLRQPGRPQRRHSRPRPLLAHGSPRSPRPVHDFALKEPVPTPWVTYPELYSASCRQGGGATWLQVASLAGTSHTRPVVNDNHLTGLAGADTGPAYGYHGYEYGLTLGDLLHDVAGEEAAWESSH